MQESVQEVLDKFTEHKCLFIWQRCMLHLPPQEIMVTSEESQNFYHFHDNRVLPSHVDEVTATRDGTHTSLLRSIPNVFILCRFIFLPKISQLLYFQIM